MSRPFLLHAQRPELANGLIPSTGRPAGFYGKIVDGLNYQFQVSQSAEDFGDGFDHRGENGAPTAGGYAAGVNGADALGFAKAPIGGFAQMSNTAAYTFRLSYQPGFLPGFAGSTAVYYSPNITPRGAYADDGTRSAKQPDDLRYRGVTACPIPMELRANMPMSTSAIRKTWRQQRQRSRQ